MEDLLIQISKDATNAKLNSLSQSATEAYVFLEKQQGTLRDPAHELRAKCLNVFKQAFETRKSKLVSHALCGLNKILRDDRFQSNFEPEDDSLWLPSQILHTISSILTQSDDTQIDMLKVFLNVACSSYWTMNGRIIIQILTLSCEVYENGNQGIRSAAQAAVSQTLRYYCNYLDEECEELNKMKENGAGGVLCFNEALPIMQFIVSKIDETQNGDRCSQAVVFYLECLHTLVASLPQKVHDNRHFTMFLWQRLCPAIIAYLGSPRVDKKIVSRDNDHATKLGRGSGVLGSAPSFNSHQSKIIYSIGCQLVRLVGCVSSLRPVLESVFHRMLLYPPPVYRIDALKALKELFSSPNRIVDFAGPILVEDSKMCQQSDMALTRLVMDSIEECSKCSDWEIVFTSVSCILSLLSTLLDLSTGKGINDVYSDKINEKFQSLSSCDYTGPLSYESMMRLPNIYREQLSSPESSVGNRSRINSTSSSSGVPSSGNTEGPEGGYQNDPQIDEMEAAVEKNLREEEIRLELVTKKLHTLNVIQVTPESVELLDMERKNAGNFVQTLVSFLPTLTPLRSTLQVDEEIQRFSSSYCEEIIRQENKKYDSIIINADGVYVATCMSLYLNLKLIHQNYYDDSSVPPIMSEDQFIENIFSSGMLMYVSSNWLAELYQHVLVTNILVLSGYKIQAIGHLALIDLLSDIDGYSSENKVNWLLSDYLRLERTVCRSETSPDIDAGIKLSRRIITCCWDTMMNVLAIPLQFDSSNDTKNTQVKKILRNELNKDSIRQMSVQHSLDALQKAATLANILGMHNRCEGIFALLVKASCAHNGHINWFSGIMKKQPKLITSHVLSMDVMLSRGLEFGCHGQECWPHIFNCALYVGYLEQVFFRQTSPSVTALKMIKPKLLTTENLNKSFGSSLDSDEEVCMDVYSFLSSPASPNNLTETISTLVNKSRADIENNGILNQEYAAQIVCILSQYVDRLFEDAALKLNLRALTEFVHSLCKTIHYELFKLPDKKKPKSNYSTNNATLLTRLSRLMLRCIKSGRPLFHMIKIWSISLPCWMEIACHKDLALSKQAIASIHDTVLAFLNDQPELSHFHINESLFKPFENLLCLELCDIEIQDQIVSCLCEFVEANRSDIRSGWRPLFGALKVVNSSNLSSLLEVFRVFLNTDDTLVFSNAAVDCIACLIKHVKGTKLCKAALKHLQHCSLILRSMYVMPACPKFHLSNRNHVFTLVDYDVPELQNVQNENYKLLSIEESKDEAIKLEEIDQPCGILRVWYCIVEGLCTAINGTTGTYQRQSLELLLDILQSFPETPGFIFGCFCINRLLLPTIQIWERKIVSTHDLSDLPNFKQLCGNSTDLIVTYLKIDKNYESKFEKEITLMIKQLLFVLNEFCIQTVENIVRLGCSCLRHFVLGAGDNFTAKQWDLISFSLHRACAISLHPLTRVSMTYSPFSDSFYGDLAAGIKVAARRDSTVDENLNLKQLSQQVFLLDHQRVNSDTIVDDERSFIFLLCHHWCNSEIDNQWQKTPERVPYKNIVLGLFVNEMLLQMIGNVLITGTNKAIPSLANILQSSLITPMDEQPSKILEKSMPGYLSSLTEFQIHTFISCLNMTYSISWEFDSRPGLKFLIQKVAGLEKAANLYKQAGGAWTLSLVTLFEICIHRTSLLSSDQIKQIIDKRSPVNDTECFILELKRIFDDACQKYIEIVMDKSGTHCVIDRAGDKPVFFFVAQNDDLFEKSEKITAFKFEDFKKIYPNAPLTSKAEDSGSEDDDAIYAIASCKNLDNLIEEYKKRKYANSMPGQPDSVEKNEENLPVEIEEQRKISMNKDSEVHELVWSEMLISVFDLLAQLDDNSFKLLLPVLFNGVRILTESATRPLLKRTLGEFYQRIAFIYGFGA
ncbi:brefeldin A-inhibited guanine nucleotide-exchange protein 3 isoform X2 [Sipha flava]|uniref:Brefeldin A-inhibited guanine nucleotide-exchange protein 3 isoform X2 n=1 Tax=Sipha flava TaxID=143950 RepID=A0A8B8FXV7_9HEMI|nr:brefeldin A-inhibited guanine nucleotide-exchange protein 3 isoform X2 [Sipha flava]